MNLALRLAYFLIQEVNTRNFIYIFQAFWIRKKQFSNINWKKNILSNKSEQLKMSMNN